MFLNVLRHSMMFCEILRLLESLSLILSSFERFPMNLRCPLTFKACY